MTEAPAWAKGYDMEFLKSAASVFKAELKPHCYGAFGLPKERDVANAMEDQSCLWATEDKSVIAVAFAKPVKRPSPHHDFCGRTATMQPGDAYIRAIAGEPDAVRRIIGAVEKRGDPEVVWVECHVENRNVVRLLTNLGFNRVMTKVSASSDLKGLFALYRADLADPRKREPEPLPLADEIASVIVKPDFVTEDERHAVLAEAEAAAQWAQHYSSYNKRHSWTAFALQGFDPNDPTFIIKPAEMSKKWKAEHPARMEARCAPTVAAEKFPVAMAIAARIPGAKERVRLMRLSAKGGELTRHADITDPDAGTRDGQLCRLHIPMQSHEQCVFRSWDLEGHEHRLHYPERALCYIDTRKPHAVINPEDVDRVHLVMDTFASAELRAWLEKVGNKKAPADAGAGLPAFSS